MRWVCPVHNISLDESVFCPRCINIFNNAKDPTEMTNQQKRDEIYYWTVTQPILTVPFNTLKKRFSELVGRPLLTHEMLDAHKLIPYD